MVVYKLYYSVIEYQIWKISELFKSKKDGFCFKWIEIYQPLFCPVGEYLELRINNTLNIKYASCRVE